MRSPAVKLAICSILFTMALFCPAVLFSQDNESAPQSLPPQAEDVFNASKFISEIKFAKDAQEARLSCENAIKQCSLTRTMRIFRMP